MADGDDANERSLFSRIKDCVLLELRRNKGDVKRATCHTRSTWALQPEKDASEQESVLDSTSEEQKEFSNEAKKDGDSKDVPHDRGSAKTGEDAVGENKGATLADDECGNNEGSRNDEETGKSRSRVIESEMDKNKEQRLPPATSDGERERSAFSSCERHGTDDKGTPVPPANSEKKAEQHSGGSEEFKPVRYYIKMQNPEAPVCCAVVQPRKVCPPKTRRPQQESRDSFTSRPNICRCGGCSANPDGYH